MSGAAPVPDRWRRLRAALGAQWFLVGLALVLPLAIGWPGLAAPGGAVHPERWGAAIVPAMFLISGLLLRTDELRSAAADWRLHLLVQGMSLLLLPALFWLAALGAVAGGLDPAIGEGLIVLGTLSTTTASGVALTRASGGDEAGALFNATLGSLLGVAWSPCLILLLTGHGATIPLGPVIGRLAVEVVLPVAAGQAVQPWVRPILARHRRHLATAGQALLLVLILLVFSRSAQSGFAAGTGQILAAIAVVGALHLAAIAAAWRAGAWPGWRLDRPRRTAAVICATQKTAALGMPLLAIVYGADPRLGLLALPLLVYHPLQLVVAGAAAPLWRRWNAARPPA